MTEPTPPGGEMVPDSVLDELKQAFAASLATEPAPQPVEPAPRPVEPARQPPTEPSAEPLIPTAPLVVRAMVGDPDGTAPGAYDPTAKMVDDGDDDGDDDGLSAPVAAKPTIVIGVGDDDDLPDAVYLDEARPTSAGGDNARRGDGARRSGDTGGGATIVIGDELDSTGAFDAVEVTTSSMDPRVRARRIAVKRAKGRRRLLWAGGVVAVVLLIVAVLAVFASSLFAVKEVVVQGAVYTDRTQLQAVIDSMTGEPVLLVDTDAAERSLEEISWVELAVVSQQFPDTVFIDIRERQPLATFQGSDGRYRVIDRDGRVLDLLTGRPVEYMLLTGPAPDTDIGGLAGPPFAAAAQMVGALPAEIRSITLTASVDATTGDLGLVLRDDIQVRLGGYDQLDSKLARLLKLVRGGLDGLVGVDVSTDDVSKRTR